MPALACFICVSTAFRRLCQHQSPSAIKNVNWLRKVATERTDGLAPSSWTSLPPGRSQPQHQQQPTAAPSLSLTQPEAAQHRPCSARRPWPSSNDVTRGQTATGALHRPCLRLKPTNQSSGHRDNVRECRGGGGESGRMSCVSVCSGSRTQRHEGDISQLVRSMYTVRKLRMIGARMSPTKRRTAHNSVYLTL